MWRGREYHFLRDASELALNGNFVLEIWCEAVQTLLNGDARFAWEQWARLKVINLSAQPVAAFDGSRMQKATFMLACFNGDLYLSCG